MLVGQLSMILAVVWLIASSLWLQHAGLVTGFAGVYMGACCGSMEKYKKEPGLWMLAGLFLFFTGLFWLMGTLQAVFSGNSSTPSVSLDWAGSTVIAGITIRILASVIVHNRKLPSSV